jgi:hypothetical protein
MNGNGSAHHPEKEEYPRENIFLFWPNIIGLLYLQIIYETRSNTPQAMYELSSRSRPYTTCHSILELAQVSIAFLACLMLSTDMPRVTSSNQLDSVPC